MNAVTTNLQPGASASEPMPVSPRPIDSERTPLIQQYLRIALRWKYVIIGVTVACVVLGLVITLLMTPKYTATATVEIARDANQVTNFQGVERQTNSVDQEFYQTQYGLLRSRALSERVATQLRLVDDPDFYTMFGISSDGPTAQQDVPSANASLVRFSSRTFR
jgi:succinoglycan biosynthesis transport protein ExoP